MREERLLTCRQAADMLGISRTTLWRAVREGRLPPPIYVFPRMPRWRYSELLAVIEASAPAEDRQYVAQSSIS